MQPWRTLLLCTAAMAFAARAQAPGDHIVTKVSAEILARPAEAGAGAALQLKAAERVVPGDVLIYTVEVRNAGRYAVESAVVVQPIPNHTMYLADSAVGPGVDVDYSVDGGRTFDKPENLKSPRTNAAGTSKAATRAAVAAAADYTHIRWRLHNRLKPDSIAYVRFRAQVK
jgi:uncharacterized repeat protein (TIGR01451 family)